jgi:uncharacterized protein (DUF305 family)
MGHGAVLLVAALSVALAACGTPASDHPAGAPATSTAVVSGAPAGYNAADQAFANSILVFDRQSMDIVALVGTRSTNSKLNALASATAATSESDVAVLRPLRVQWSENPDIQSGGGGPSAIPNGPLDRAAIGALKGLHDSAFDQLWLQANIKIDEAAINVSQDEIAHGKNIDAIDVAKVIVSSRRAQIDRMNQMLKR